MGRTSHGSGPDTQKKESATLNPTFSNTTVRRVPFTMGLLLLVSGPMSEVFGYIDQNTSDKQQIVMMGVSREAAPNPYVEILVLDDDFTGKTVADAKAEIEKETLQALLNENLDYANFARDTGKGQCLLNGEKNLDQNPNGKNFAVATFFLLFDAQGFVKGDPGKSRALLAYAPRDIERVTIGADKQQRMIAIPQAFPDGKVRNAIAADATIEVIEGGTKIAVLTQKNLEDLFDGQTVEPTKFDFTKFLGTGTFEEISLEMGKDTFLATLKGGKNRFLPITVSADADGNPKLVPHMKDAIPSDELDGFDDHGGIVRFDKLGAVLVDRNGGKNALTFRGIGTLPARMQQYATDYATA